MVCLGTIGEKIARKRREKGWTQKQLAYKAGISSAYLVKIESGDKIPSLETFVSIVSALDASADELLSDALDRSGGAEMICYIEKIEQKDCATRILIYKVLDTLLEALCEKDENRQRDYLNRNSYYTGL